MSSEENNRLDPFMYFFLNLHMALKEQIAFEQILTVVKTLTPVQKAELKDALSAKPNKPKKSSNFTELLLSGPVFTKKQIATIKDNRKSIAAWRTKK
jgi:hypothetical protein